MGSLHNYVNRKQSKQASTVLGGFTIRQLLPVHVTTALEGLKMAQGGK